MSKSRQWVTITAVVVLVILAGGYLLLIKSQKSKVADLQAQTQDQLSQNQLLLTQISQLQALQSQLPAEQQALAKFSTEIPDNAAEPTLIRQLSSAARGSGVDLTSIAPGSAAAVSASAASAQTLGGSAAAPLTLYKLPLTLAVSGSYANVESFFQTLEKLPRSLLVDTFSISPGTTVTGAHNVTVSMSVGVFFTPMAAGTSTTDQSQTLEGAAPSDASNTPTTPDAASTPAPSDNPSTASTPAPPS